MPIIITDEDAERLLSIPEAIEAMRVAFRDFSEGRAINPPRVRYSTTTPDPTLRYNANIQAGAVQTSGVACVRAGSSFSPAKPPDGNRVTITEAVNWTVVILYDLVTGEPLAFMHESYVSGLRVGATSALAVSELARSDASELGIFGTGLQAVPACRAIAAVRPIKRVRVYSPNPQHRAAFIAEMRGEAFDTIAVEDPREVVRGAHVIACCTSSKKPVLQGEWLEPGQMLITIGNSDVMSPRHEVDEATFARASEIVINDWDSVAANQQIELSGPIASGLVKREDVHELGDILSGKATLKREPGGIIFYKNNTGLAIQFAACGAILNRKLRAEGTNRTIPTEWFASGEYKV